MNRTRSIAVAIVMSVLHNSARTGTGATRDSRLTNQ